MGKRGPKPRPKGQDGKPIHKALDPVTGQYDLNKVFEFQPKQEELRRVPQNKTLCVGGVRSGKTSGTVMHGVLDYLLMYPGCAMLVIRRTWKELEEGVIRDFLAFTPPEWFNYNQQSHVATFFNGSRIVFGHCEHGTEKDVQQYLGTVYVVIILDEAAQFSPAVWEMLCARNTINPECQPAADGSMPIARIIACTNPFGEFWHYYHTIFVLKEPVDKEGLKKDANGCWRRQTADGWELEFDPTDYAYIHSTVMDNLALLRRDPNIVKNLQALPKAKRDKMLYGYMGVTEGQFYDCWSPEYHIVNLRADPEAIIWQEWQPVWGGWDYGLGHYSAFFWFTKALVKTPFGDYKLKTVCFAEVIERGKAYNDQVDLIVGQAVHPGTRKAFRPSAIYFSHEKFNRVITERTPADEVSHLLRQKGLCSVSPATRDRIARANFLYNLLKNGDLVILDHCRNIINAIPNLMRNPKNLDDVLKIDGKQDDAYDGFSYGLFGQLSGRAKSKDAQVRERAAKITDPTARLIYLYKKMKDKEQADQPFKQNNAPSWASRLPNTN